MGNGICHSGDLQEQEIQHCKQQNQKIHILEPPNSYAKSPSKPTIETQNPTISLNHEDCYDILLTSSLDMIHLGLDVTSIKNFDEKEKNRISTNPILPNVKNSAKERRQSVELSLPNSSNKEPKPILKISERLKENQSKKTVRFNDLE